MKTIIPFLAFTCLVFSTVSRADSFSGNCDASKLGTLVATCVQHSSSPQDDGTIFKAYRLSPQVNSFCLMVQTNQNQVMGPLASIDSAFSEGGKVLDAQFGFVILHIAQGHQTEGTVGVELGAPAEKATCDAIW